MGERTGSDVAAGFGADSDDQAGAHLRSEADDPMSALVPLARLVARQAVLRRRRAFTILAIPVWLAVAALLVGIALVLASGH